jgi:FAD/FMN-containing dehydrogenase/Fe-S oxidoreductase
MSTAAAHLHALEKALRRHLRGEVAFDPHVLGMYATDASNYQIRPLGVVVPRDAEDVATALELAAEYQVCVLPRGGGTSLSGQTVGQSLILDLSKFMNALRDVDAPARRARVEPGLVRDELNARLAPHRLHFAPDPATSSRANIGGMIANNASGMRSILYGKTLDHVLETDVLLADGTRLHFGPLPRATLDAKAQEPTREGRLLRDFRDIVLAHRDEIRARFPKVMRRVGGYNLDAFVDTDDWNLSKLIVGSEGTLGVLVGATLNLEPLPRATALCVAHFASLLEAIRAVEPILTHGPSAVELLDHVVLTKAHTNRSTAALAGFIEGDPQAVLIIECYGDTRADAERRVGTIAEDLRARGFGYAHPILAEPSAQANVWLVRKNGLGLMLGVRGDRKPTPFIEDACVPISVLPDYIERVLAICAEHGVPLSLYAHASVGLLHVRPLLDLRRAEDIGHMKAIADKVFALVVEYGGSWSGEHGDGLVRSAFNERFFGPTLYQAFRDVKRLFDPQGRMNPGKIVDAPAMDQNLRYGAAYHVLPFRTEYHYRSDGTFAAAVELCTGVGQCRKTLSGVMCPSYIATRDEEHSTRGRANALRLAMTGQLGADGMTSPRLHQTLDLCLSCKGCKSECPSNVDMAKLKSEFLQQYHDKHGSTRRERVVAASPAMARRLTGALAPLVNRLQEAPATRRLIEATLGFSRERVLPPYARVPFADWFANRVTRPAGDRPRVALFGDTYLSCFEPGVGRAAVDLLEGCGFEVVFANAGCCQRPRISHGFLREAKRDGLRTLLNLDHFIRQGIPIVVCEPGCASALVDDLPDLIDDAALAQRIVDNVMMIDVFLEREYRAGRIACTFEAVAPSVTIHGHCHQRALFGTSAMKALLARAPGAEIRELDAGCCGMAGSFGYEKEHYALSQKIGESRLFPAVRALPADGVLVACGFSCRHQIAHFTGRKTLHWVETLRAKPA